MPKGGLDFKSASVEKPSRISHPKQSELTAFHELGLPLSLFHDHLLFLWIFSALARVCGEDTLGL